MAGQCRSLIIISAISTFEDCDRRKYHTHYSTYCRLQKEPQIEDTINGQDYVHHTPDPVPPIL